MKRIEVEKERMNERWRRREDLKVKEVEKERRE